MAAKALSRLGNSRVANGLLVAIGFASPLAAQASLDIKELMGKPRSEITSVFPGRASTIKAWRAWERVMLLTNRSGQLVTVVLEPPSPMTEQQADDAIERLGIEVDDAKYFLAPAERGYGEMTGLIRTVIYTLDGDKVKGIGIFSRLANDE